MKKTRLLLGALLVLGVGTVVAGISVVLAEQRVSLEQVPPAVRTTIEKYVGGGEIVKIEREKAHGKQVYEVEAVVDGKKTEFQVSAAGKYLGPEDEDDNDGDAEDEDDDEGKDTEDEEESVGWDQLPQVVQDALRATLPDIEGAKYVHEIEDGFTVYEAGCSSDGTEHGIKVTEQGQIVETEEKIAPSVLPPAVAAQLQKQCPGAEIEGAERVVLTFYEVKLKAGGREREIRMFADGRMLEEEED